MTDQETQLAQQIEEKHGLLMSFLQTLETRIRASLMPIEVEEQPSDEDEGASAAL